MVSVLVFSPFLYSSVPLYYNCGCGFLRKWMYSAYKDYIHFFKS